MFPFRQIARMITKSTHLICGRNHRCMLSTSSLLYTDKKEEDIFVSAAISEKYVPFKDEDSPIIFDIEEEKRKQLELDINKIEHEEEDVFFGIDLNRGVHGVFDIEQLVDILRKEKMKHIFVVKLPEEWMYVDYIVVVTGRSLKHMQATAEFIRKVFKRKRRVTDVIPRIEGESCRDWIAIDLGNIALHIFSSSARTVYDLESLWSVGEEHDIICNKPDPLVVQLINKHSIYLGDLKPANTCQ